MSVQTAKTSCLHSKGVPENYLSHHDFMSLANSTGCKQQICAGCGLYRQWFYKKTFVDKFPTNFVFLSKKERRMFLEEIRT